MHVLCKHIPSPYPDFCEVANVSKFNMAAQKMRFAAKGPCRAEKC